MTSSQPERRGVNSSDEGGEPNPLRLPDIVANVAFVYVADYAPEVEATGLELIHGRQVVLVARGSELAGIMAKRFSEGASSLLVVNILNDSERQRYSSWLSELATRSPTEDLEFTLIGLDPQCGHPGVWHGRMNFLAFLDIAAGIINPKPGDDAHHGGRPAELWLEMPVDVVPAWVAGRGGQSAFDVPSERGMLRVELGGSDPIRRVAQFHVYRSDTHEPVAQTHVLLNGECVNGIDSDIFEVLAPLPETTNVVLRPMLSSGECTHHNSEPMTLSTRWQQHLN